MKILYIVAVYCLMAVQSTQDKRPTTAKHSSGPKVQFNYQKRLGNGSIDRAFSADSAKTAGVLPFDLLLQAGKRQSPAPNQQVTTPSRVLPFDLLQQVGQQQVTTPSATPTRVLPFDQLNQIGEKQSQQNNQQGKLDALRSVSQNNEHSEGMLTVPPQTVPSSKPSEQTETIPTASSVAKLPMATEISPAEPSHISSQQTEVAPTELAPTEVPPTEIAEPSHAITAGQDLSEPTSTKLPETTTIKLSMHAATQQTEPSDKVTTPGEILATNLPEAATTPSGPIVTEALAENTPEVIADKPSTVNNPEPVTPQVIGNETKNDLVSSDISKNLSEPESFVAKPVSTTEAAEKTSAAGKTSKETSYEDGYSSEEDKGPSRKGFYAKHHLPDALTHPKLPTKDLHHRNRSHGIEHSKKPRKHLF